MVEDHISPSCYKLLALHMTNSSGWQQMDMLEYLEKCSGPRRFSPLKTSKLFFSYFFSQARPFASLDPDHQLLGKSNSSDNNLSQILLLG